MGPYVFVALAVAVFLGAMVAVVVRELVRNVRGLTGQVRATTERLVPLTQELRSELAVTSLEVEGLSRAVAQAQKERTTRRKRRKPRRKG